MSHRHRRLYLPRPLECDSEVAIEGERARYVRTVLRLRPGALLTVFNGEGGEFEARIAAVGRHRVRLQVETWHGREAESPLKVHLGLAVAKGDRMDWAVQKAVELGVEAITPLLSERVNVKLEEERAERRRAHWQAVAVAACEQCGRNRVPPLQRPQSLSAWLNRHGGGILLDPGAGRSLSALPPPKGDVALLIGPEGGLSEAEVQQAKSSGFLSASLGPRILRVETAVAAALAVMQTLWGDF